MEKAIGSGESAGAVLAEVQALTREVAQLRAAILPARSEERTTWAQYYAMREAALSGRATPAAAPQPKGFASRWWDSLLARAARMVAARK